MTLILNKHGYLVRKQKAREVRPAIDRFFDHIKELDCGMAEPCLIWQASELFRVSDTKLVRPWKFIWELMEGRFAPPGAWWAWSCPNEGTCCQWEHLKYKGQYCRS